MLPDSLQNRNISLPIILAIALILTAGNLSFNGAYYDEALHIIKGRLILQGDFSYDPLGTTFGLGLFYPTISAYLDSIGGLQLVRFFSSILGLTTLSLLYFTGKSLSCMRTGLLAALILTLQAPFIFISHFGTQDMLAITLFTLSIMLITYGYRLPERRIAYLSLAVVVLFIASLAKYTVVLFVPFLLLLILYMARDKRYQVRLAMLSLTIFGGYFLVVILPHLDKQILTITTTQSANITPRHVITAKIIRWTWIPAVLSVFGFHSRKARISLLLLLAGALLIPAYHLMFSTAISLHKHISYPLLLLSLAAGKGINELFNIFDLLRLQQMLKPIVILLLCLIQFPYELKEIHWLDHQYPDARKTVEYLKTDIDNETIILADSATVYRYYLSHKNVRIYGTYFFEHDNMRGDKGIIEFVHKKIPHIIILDWYGRPDLDKKILKAMDNNYTLVHASDAGLSWGKREVEVYKKKSNIKNQN